MSIPAAQNPRRRAAARPAANETCLLADSFQNMSLRKGDTFHPQCNTSQSSFWDPLESRANPPSMPSRSATSPQSLEDLLIGAGERRIAQLLDNVDRAISTQSKAALGNVLSEPEVLPLPGFMVDSASLQEPQRAQSRNRHHSHTSDSGLGSSVADSSEATSSSKGSASTVTPGTQTFSSISDASDDERGLSKYAAEQIHKHIVKPILREESLKEFHDLIKTVPERIGDREIKNLRDLEKTLIFLAPDYSRSPSKYLRFCERTIRVLHTTVTTLHESDQRAPTDRPYTQGYFFELVEQIRRYATILAITREKQAKGEKLDAMDVTENEQLSLHGGMSRNGKPAELVRHTADGKVISLASGQTISTEEIASSSSMKRPAEADIDDDEEALRSMARRKKNAKPEIHTCELCSKEFKRPCDLTKHVKTHERPWKCSSEDCKYHEYGWPTEKERDRHVNDKHSSTPSLYHCLFKPCPYTSKRESNCKQHMEKAHGWHYVRSKSNGKGRVPVTTRLPQGSVPPSPASAVLTPIAPSPSNQSLTNSSRHGSMAPPPTTGPSSYNSPIGFGTPAFAQPSPDFAHHFDMNSLANFDFNAFPSYPLTPAMSEERRTSDSLSSHSGATFDVSSFDDGSPHDFHFNDFDFQMEASEYQQYTPNSSVAGPSTVAAFMHASPGAQMDQTFTNDAMAVDEYNSFAAPGSDFTLYGGGGSTTAGAVNGDMFPAMSWGNLHCPSHLDSAPALPTGNSTLDDLFPELRN